MPTRRLGVAHMDVELASGQLVHEALGAAARTSVGGATPENRPRRLPN